MFDTNTVNERRAEIVVRQYFIHLTSLAWSALYFTINFTPFLSNKCLVQTVRRKNVKKKKIHIMIAADPSLFTTNFLLLYLIDLSNASS